MSSETDTDAEIVLDLDIDMDGPASAPESAHGGGDLPVEIENEIAELESALPPGLDLGIDLAPESESSSLTSDPGRSSKISAPVGAASGSDAKDYSAEAAIAAAARDMNAELEQEDAANAMRASDSDTESAEENKWLQDLHPDIVRAIPYAFAKRHDVLPLYEQGGVIYALCAQKPKLDVAMELRRQLGAGIDFHPIGEDRFVRMLRAAYDKGQSEATQMVDDLGDEVDLERLAHEIPETTDLLEVADDAPIVRLINALLTQAIREDASDIHLEAFEARSVVRFRVDGVLRDIVEPQRALHGALVSRLKVMAKLDIAEKRLPQDGRISLRVGGKPIDVRVSTLPTQHGERVVLRLLDKSSAKLDLSDLGLKDQMKDKFDALVHLPHGMVLVTGPTGSGKTTTLYAGLLRLDRSRLNILTIEDPIEYDLDGVGQTQVHSKIGLTFAAGLRTILRQDPDVVLVGEIRDLETAEIAIQSSLTGHLVLSTLHTNTAIGAVTRLMDMGVEPFLIASSISGVLAQRLVRALCPNCKKPHQPEGLQRHVLGLDDADETVVYRPGGCDQCDGSGYRGRFGIFELIVVDDRLRTLIHDRCSEEEMLGHLRTTTVSLARYGFQRVLDGETSIDEVLRVSQDS